MQPDFRDEWLNRLAQRMQLRELIFDQDGLCQFKLDQKFAVTIYKAANTSALTLFGQVPVNFLSADLIKQMLIENRNHANEAAPVLSLDEHVQAIEVHLKLSPEDLDVIEDPLGLLVTSMEYWRTQGSTHT